MGLENGFIPISRKLFEHAFWQEKRKYSYAEAWIDLVRMARFEEDSKKVLIDGRMIEIKRGEVPVSLRYLGGLWDWSKNKTSKFLNTLCSEKMIELRTQEGTRQTIVTILNYDTYNKPQSKDGTKKGQKKDKLGTNLGQTRDNTNKENKENKEIKNPYPFVENSFKDCFMDFLEYKKSRKETYKNEKSVQAAYRRLEKLSRGDPEIASQIIEQSMANNWAGLFELKNGKSSLQTSNFNNYNGNREFKRF